MESQLATLATDTGTTFAKLFQVEEIQTILFKFWSFRVYTLNNLTPIRLFCVKGLSGIKTDHVWPEIRPLGFKGLKATYKCFNKLQENVRFVTQFELWSTVTPNFDGLFLKFYQLQL